MAHNAAIIVLLFAMAIVAFWRTVIKYLIMIAATAVIATLGYGAVMMWQNMHHIIM
jgi:glucan phosphoethanolaminetransferase (alkaline phosphatase superfamily)